MARKRKICKKFKKANVGFHVANEDLLRLEGDLHDGSEKRLNSRVPLFTPPDAAPPESDDGADGAESGFMQMSLIQLSGASPHRLVLALQMKAQSLDVYSNLRVLFIIRPLDTAVR